MRDIPVLVTILWMRYVTATDMGARELADKLEEEISGSVKWLTDWAIMDRSIDYIDAIYCRLIPPPRGDKDARIVAYYVLSLNPEMSDDEFQFHMYRIFQNPNLVSVEWKQRVLGSLSVPSWFFVELCIQHQLGRTVGQAIGHMISFVQERKDTSLELDESRIQSLVSVWWVFGLTKDPHGDYPVICNQPKNFYTMKSDTQRLTLQHLSLGSIVGELKETNEV